MEEPKYRWITFLAGGILIVFYMSFCAVILSISNNRDIPVFNPTTRDVVTSTVQVVVTPQILFDIPQDQKFNFENFTSNYRGWNLYFRAGKVEIINGKMVVQSYIEEPAIVSNQNFIKTSDTYYLQADLIADKITINQEYGLVFGLNGIENTLYLFEINPEENLFRLFKHTIETNFQISNSHKPTKHDWIILIDYTRANMNQYPKENILGVHFDKGIIQLFINGIQVANHIDKQPLQFSGVGVYISNTGYRLIVDNFFAYTE